MAEYKFLMSGPAPGDLIAVGTVDGADKDELKVGDEADAGALEALGGKIKIQKKMRIIWHPEERSKDYFRNLKTNKATIPYITFTLQAGGHAEVRFSMVKVTITDLPTPKDRGTQVVKLACESVR